MVTRCTHVALQASDIKRSIAFYEKYCQMQVMKDHTDKHRIVWMGWGEQPASFLIALLDDAPDVSQRPPHQHIGMEVSSRDEVDAIYARATAEGISDVWPPTEGGAGVGYLCGVADPDGNMVEFSCGREAD